MLALLAEGQTQDGVEPWAATVAEQKAGADLRVIETREQADESRHEQQRLNSRQMRYRTDFRRQGFGHGPTPPDHGLGL